MAKTCKSSFNHGVNTKGVYVNSMRTNLYISNSLVVCVILGTLFLFTGCISDKIMVTVDVPDCGERVVTKNRYRLQSFIDYKADEYVTSGGQIRRYERAANMRRHIFEKCQPGVFSGTGIPIVVDGADVYMNLDKRHQGQTTPTIPFLCYLASCGILPFILSYESDDYSSLESVDGIRVDADLSMHVEIETAVTIPLSPLGQWFSLGREGSWQLDGQRIFVRRKAFNNGNDAEYNECANELLLEALAYGIAVKLKELEDCGQIQTHANGGL